MSEEDDTYKKLMAKINRCIFPSEEELFFIKKRLIKYDKEELLHLEKNFEAFGIDVIVECMCSAIPVKINQNIHLDKEDSYEKF